MGDKRDAPVRQAMVGQRPDPTDAEAWPDVRSLPGRLLPALDLVGADIEAARARGLPHDRLVTLREALRETREALIQLHGLSPLEAWRLTHPPRLDPLDEIYDCGSPDCPAVGFASVEDKVLHYRRWGIPL